MTGEFLSFSIFPQFSPSLFHDTFGSNLFSRSIAITYEKPFSFSDEAINVKLPYTEGVPTAGGLRDGQPITLTLAIEGFKFTKINSKWYQHLWYSDHQPNQQPIEDPQEYTKAQSNELQKWWGSLPNTIDPLRKQWLRLEYYYMQLCLLTPRIPESSNENTLSSSAILECCFAYVTTFQNLLFQPRQSFNYNYCDVLRLFNVSQKLIEALCRIEGHLPDQDLKSQGLSCIQIVRTLLSVFTKRFHEAEEYKDRFEQDSSIIQTTFSAGTSPYEPTYPMSGANLYQHM